MASKAESRWSKFAFRRPRKRISTSDFPPLKPYFKGGKSLVEIRFQETQPDTTWARAAPSEYGFFANVNPEVDQPRWRQATERRIGELSRRKTLAFNGYGAYVAELYRGMDLARYF